MAAPKSRKSADEVEVVVYRMGARPVRVWLEEGSTVQDAIDEAGYSVKAKDEVTVNGDKASLDTEVEELDRVQITPKFQGGR